MDILITGGTGFIGGPLVAALCNAGHNLTLLTREPTKVVAQYRELVTSQQVRVVNTLDILTPDTHFHAIINLAGEGIANRPWTAQRKRELYDSRVSLTKKLVLWIAQASHKPDVLISGSAIGWYGSQGDLLLEEDAPAHDEYVHQLCHDWEQAALAAASTKTRVCILRTGVVVGAGGGFLRRLLPVFGLGLGGPIASGEQYLSWVALADVVQAIQFLLNDNRQQGHFNITAPRPINNTEFTRALAKLVHRPAFFRVPAVVLKLAMGDMSTLLLDGQRVLPSRLLQAGFIFQYPTIEGALRAAISK